MASQTQKFDNRLGFVHPNQKEIAPYMAFHTVLVISDKGMWTIFFWDNAIFF